jgi:hypothetical protein
VITLPPPPDALPADTYSARHRVWWEQCDVLLRQASIAASEAHGAAQQATAVALQANVAAQQEMAAALALPTPQRLPTRAELVFAILRDHPQATILTNGQLVTGCKNIVDAYVAQYPAAVAP